jgi:hypothetical protein
LRKKKKKKKSAASVSFHTALLTPLRILLLFQAATLPVDRSVDSAAVAGLGTVGKSDF